MKGIVVAGTHSGVGKTTVAIGLMALLRRRGLKVQPFKVGPDYLDPTYHDAACGVPARHLDSWLLEPKVIAELFHRALRGKDLAVIEGVMGLYDGFRGENDVGSTAQLSKLLGLPVILVIDAAASARSVGAMALGFKNFDAEVNLAGVILNGIAGEKHLEFVKPSLEKVGVRLLGYLPRLPELSLPERHLGLVPSLEAEISERLFCRLARQVEQTIDWRTVLDLAAWVSPPVHERPIVFPEAPVPRRIAIGVATDKAFSFYYADSLELLEAWGADIVPFSPLSDSKPPTGISGLYIGGGYPELYGRELAENSAMRQSVREAAQKGLPIYAECGGLMYLGESIEDFEGRNHPMAGVFPYRSTVKGTKLTLGYRDARALEDNPLMRAGETIRGHEFHLSALVGEAEGPKAYEVQYPGGWKEGFRFKNTLASYIHLHFGSKKSLAPAFVASCTQWRAITNEPSQ